jgi:tetratricopeptide (TPR) repeat protein
MNIMLQSDFDFLWNPLNLPASEAALRARYLATSGQPDSDRSSNIEILSLIARAESAQNRLAEAKVTLQQAQKLLAEKEIPHRVSAKIRWLLESGRISILDKTPSQARIAFAEAFTLASNSGEDYLAVEVAQMIATVEPQKTQQEWIMRAIGIAEISPQLEAKRWLGSLYTSLGWKLYDLRQYEKSLETFQKSLSHLKIHGSDREIFLAKWSAGKVLRTMNRTEEALAIQKGLLSELGIGGAKDGRLFEELAECLHTLKRESEAEIYFDLAYRELSNDEWVTDNQPVKLKRMKDLGKVKIAR